MNQVNPKSTQLKLQPEIKKVPPTKEENQKALEISFLRYIIEMRYLSMAQVVRRFKWVTKECGTDVIALVKEQLTKAQIKSKDMSLNDQSLLTVTQKGYELVAAHTTKERVPKYSKSIFLPRVKHDMLLNELRLNFEEWGFLKKWVSEMLMEEIPFFKRQFQNLPDALCKKKNDKSYFLELEVSKKSAKVYAERVAEYVKVLALEEIKDAGIEGVIFVCTDPEVLEMIKKQIPEGTKGISVLPYSKYERQLEVPKQAVNA